MRLELRYDLYRPMVDLTYTYLVLTGVSKGGRKEGKRRWKKRGKEGKERGRREGKKEEEEGRKEEKEREGERERNRQVQLIKIVGKNSINPGNIPCLV